METPDTKNYYYELLRKKFHTSEIVRSQIDATKKKIKDRVIKEPVKMLTVTFSGEVVKTAFEKTLKIVSRHLFVKGKITSYNTIKERGVVEANFTATQTEVEELIRFLMKRHAVLHWNKTIAKGASDTLIIKEEEQKHLVDFKPDYIRCNYVTTADICEKYTGRLGDFLIDNGVPLTTETLGSELRFNIIETKNKVYTSAGLKEIFLHMHFITVVLMLDLEQHYFKLRIFNAQEADLKAVEDSIDSLGLFTELFERIGDEGNPLLFNNELFVDLIRLEHIIEKGNWKSLPAYDSYVYSALKSLDNHLKFLDEFGLFLTHANCSEKLLDQLNKKLLAQNSNFQKEQDELDTNYHELRKLKSIASHPLLKNSYQETLSSFTDLLEHVDGFLNKDAGNGDSATAQKENPIPEKKTKSFVATLRSYAKSILSSSPDSSQNQVSGEKQAITTKQVERAHSLVSKVKENLRKISELKAASGKNAYGETKKNVPFLTNLSAALDQLKKLIKDIERGKDIQDQFRNIFDRKNKFVTFFNELSKVVKFKTKKEEKNVQDSLDNLQKLLHDRPLKEDNYSKILDNINTLESVIQRKRSSTQKKSEASPSVTRELSQNETLRNIFSIKTGIQNILEKEKQIRNIKTFKNEADFLSLSESELNSYLEELVSFHEELKITRYFGKISNFKETESKFDRLIEKVNEIEDRISSRKRSKKNTVLKVSDSHIDFLKSSMVARKNLEDTIILIQRQIAQALEFIKTIKSFLDQHSFVHSGVSTSVLFDQITYLLSNTDLRALDLTKLTEDMYYDSVSTIFQYQVGEKFAQPEKADMNNLMKKIEQKSVIKTYQNKK